MKENCSRQWLNEICILRRLHNQWHGELIPNFYKYRKINSKHINKLIRYKLSSLMLSISHTDVTQWHQ